MAASQLTLNDLLPLPNSTVKIPQLGFGVYLSLDKQCVVSSLLALKAGYRHIDTAQLYGNEKEVGEAVRQSGLKRSDIFLTTKIMTSTGNAEKTYNKVLDSVIKIDGENGFVDLFLIHTASGGKAARKDMWLALEKLQEAGKARSIGVSNFGVGHIEEMKEYAKIWPPTVNQLEV
jgi:diketogulonate reductase-like aldo/keto reductase